MRRKCSRCSICLYPGQNGRCTHFIENSTVRMSWYLDTSTETQMAKIMGENWGKSSKLKMLIRTPWKRTILVFVCTISNCLERNKTLIRHGKSSWKTLIWENQHHSSTMFIWVALKENARSARILWIITEVCSNQGFLPGLQKNCQKQKPRWNLMPKRYLHWSYDMEGHAKKCVEDIANLRIKQLSNFSRSRRHAWKIIKLKKKKMNRLEIFLLFASKLSWNVYIWHVLVDLIFFRSVNNLARAATKWTKACDKRLARLISCIDHTCHYMQYFFWKHSTTLHIRIVSRLWFRRRPWRLEVNIRRNSMHFRKSNVRASKLDVQETHICFTRFYRSWGDFSRHQSGSDQNWSRSIKRNTCWFQC